MEAIKKLAAGAGGGYLFSKDFEAGQLFTIRPINLEKDIPVIHRWVNMEYAIPFWQMNVSREELTDTYASLLRLPYVHSFAGCVDGQLACQLDAYDPVHDLVGKFYPAEVGDIGIHMLLGPEKKSISNFSAKIVWAFCEWFFQQPGTRRVVAEPDHRNRAATWLLRRLRFDYAGQLDLPEKTAALFIMDRSRFKSIGGCPA
jgi:RimJ/RimL family protein N-acetyltransferase